MNTDLTPSLPLPADTYYYDAGRSLLSLKDKGVISKVETVKAMMELPIAQLTIEGCSFTKEAWKVLCLGLNNCALTAVKVTHCLLDDQDIKWFMTALKTKSLGTLIVLNLEDNGIKATGVPYITDFIQVASQLKEFSLENNLVDNVSVLALTQGLMTREAPIDLNLSSSRLYVTHVSFTTLLRRVRCLNRLNLSRNKKIKCMQLLAPACWNMRLKRLSLLGTKISNSSVQEWLSETRIIVCPEKQNMQVDFPFDQLTSATKDLLVRSFANKPIHFSLIPQ